MAKHSDKSAVEKAKASKPNGKPKPSDKKSKKDFKNKPAEKKSKDKKPKKDSKNKPTEKKPKKNPKTPKKTPKQTVDTDTKHRRKRRDRMFTLGVQRIVKANPSNTEGKTGRAICRPPRAALNQIMQALSIELATSAFEVSRCDGRGTLYPVDLETVVSRLYPAELAESATKYALEAATRYETETAKHTADTSEDKGSLQQTERARLTISVPVSKHMIERVQVKGRRIGSTAAVYLAALCEHLCKRLVAGAIAAADETKHSNIKTVHLQRALLADAELSQLFSRLRFRLVNSAVLPWIDPRMIPNKKHQRELARKRRITAIIRKDKGIAETAKRANPGVVARRAVKAQQKSTKSMLAQATFDRIARSFADKDVRFADGVLPGLLCLCEQITVDVVREAVKISLLSGQTLYPPEVSIVCSSSGHLPVAVREKVSSECQKVIDALIEKHENPSRKKTVDDAADDAESEDESEDENAEDADADAEEVAPGRIPSSAINRMCQKAGAVRISKRVTPLLATMFRALTDHYVGGACAIMEARHAKTVKFGDLQAAAKMFDQTTLIFPAE